MGYDIIGDVHGQIGKLSDLLTRLGYRMRDGAWRHPEGRKALFLGDLIDRGPGQVEVVRLVRQMIEAGSGLSIMGNHEWNAIGFATPREDGPGFLRPHSPGKRRDHAAFLAQVGEGSALHREMVDWFRTLPPFLDLGGIRLCHAWWDPRSIAALARQQDVSGGLNEDFLRASFDPLHHARHAMEAVTKGMEIALPQGSFFLDHNGSERREIRVRWWDEQVATYRDAALVPERSRSTLPALGLPPSLTLGPSSPVPTFVGHYWLTGQPSIQNATTAVLDYSAAGDGPLVAYRWEGEAQLSNAGFVLSNPGA